MCLNFNLIITGLENGLGIFCAVSRNTVSQTCDPHSAKGISFQSYRLRGWVKVRILTSLRAKDIKIIVSRDNRILLPKSWVCYVALMNLHRNWDALGDKVKETDADLKAYYHHDNKITSSVISSMKLITEDWQQQQQKDF